MTGVIELKKPVSENISEQTSPNETKAMPIGTARHLIRNSETLIVLMIWKNNIPKKEMLFRFFVRMGGLEPPLREELDPKSNAATNYATSA